MLQAIQLSLAVLLDAIIGEVKVAHPLVFFGRLANNTEKLFYGQATVEKNPVEMRLRGLAALLLLIIVPVCLLLWLQTLPQINIGIQIAALYFAIGMRSLKEHADLVSKALASNNLQDARRNVSKIVSRDTSAMESSDVCTAAIESVLENGNDAVFAPLFWFIIAGAPGVVLYRLTNTLDAMWGYKNDRYLYFGWAAARLDDVLNFIPARLTALTYTALGHSQTAWQCWRSQALKWYSPNAGPVMAAGAGALRVRLGGAAFYHGKLKARPDLGTGNTPGFEDIGRSVKLVQNGLIIWLLVSLIAGAFHARTWW